VGVLLRGGLEGTLPLQCSLDFDRRYGRMLLYDAMRAYHHRSAVEKVRLQLLADLGHTLRRPAADYLRDGIHELRAKANRVQYRMPALYLSLGGQAIEPIQKRCASILILKKDDRHRWCPNLRSLANLLNYNNMDCVYPRPHWRSRLAFLR
jgi:hypothetical protein